MTEGGATFDLISFDACLMNSVELNLALAGLTDCYVASAETEPGYGQDYSGWFKAIGQNPDMNPFEVGKIIVDDFVAFYSDEKGVGFGQSGTLAAVDTKRLLASGFVDSLNQMNQVLDAQVTPASGDDYLYYDELGSVEHSIVYGIGWDTYRDFGNLADQICVPLREFAARSAEGGSVKDEGSRQFLANYPDTVMKYALLAETGKAVG